VITPAEVAARHTISSILQPARSARIVQQHALNDSLPGLDEVLNQLIESVFEEAPADSYQAEIRRAVQRVLVDELMRLASSAPMPQARAVASLWLEELAENLEDSAEGRPERAHRRLLAADISRFLERPSSDYPIAAGVAPPPGAPIGEPALEWLLPFCSHP
jgi:hypothetical protein